MLNFIAGDRMFEISSTAVIILCFNKHRLTQVHLENGRLNGERVSFVWNCLQNFWLFYFMLKLVIIIHFG